MTVEYIHNVEGKYVAYDKNKDTYIPVTVHIPCAKITYRDNEIPIIDIIDTGEGGPLYYIAINEED